MFNLLPGLQYYAQEKLNERVNEWMNDFTLTAYAACVRLNNAPHLSSRPQQSLEPVNFTWYGKKGCRGVFFFKDVIKLKILRQIILKYLGGAKMQSLISL